MLYAFTLVFIDFLPLQLTITSVSSILIMAYILRNKPLNSKLLNGLEFSNECGFFLMTMSCYLFTDYAPEDEYI